MHLKLNLIAICFAVNACSSTSVNANPPVRSEGIGSDLRVFFDSKCIEDETQETDDKNTTRAISPLLAELAVGGGTLVFETIGRAIQDAAATKIDQSTALSSGYLFTKEGAFNRDIACVHVVREGFESQKNDTHDVDPIFLKTWSEDLKLLSTPSFYALIVLEVSARDPRNMRGTLERLYVSRFERKARRGERDYLLSIEFEKPQAQGQVLFTDAGTLQINKTGPFARGVFRLPGIEKNRTFQSAELEGLETGWMPLTNLADDRSGAFNMYVDVIELKRGDPVLADLAALLRKKEVVEAATSEITDLVDPIAKDRRKATLVYEARETERALVSKLQAEIRELASVLNEPQSTSEALQAAIDEIDEAIFQVERQEATTQWRSESPEGALNEARELLVRAREKIRELVR